MSFRPNIAFLRKVADRKVFKSCSYRPRRGTIWRLVGGEKTILAHAAAGLIKPPYIADLGRPSYAELTDAGRALLASWEPLP